MTLHIGNRIREVLMSQTREHTVTWFAAQLNCDRRNVYDIFSRRNIDVELLLRICRVLDHDFFEEIRGEIGKSDI